MNELTIKENDLIVKNNTLRIVEYKGEKVVSSYDIARLHNKEVKRVNEQFERNKDRLQEDVDYFLIKKEEFAVADSDHKISSKSRHKFERLFTERDYLKLVKSFTDDLRCFSRRLANCLDRILNIKHYKILVNTMPEDWQLLRLI